MLMLLQLFKSCQMFGRERGTHLQVFFVQLPWNNLTPWGLEGMCEKSGSKLEKKHASICFPSLLGAGQTGKYVFQISLDGLIPNFQCNIPPTIPSASALASHCCFV